MPHIVLLEDDPDWESQARAALEWAFAETLQLELIETESQFVEELENGAFVRRPPDLFVIDVMLPWDIPGPRMRPAPKGVSEDGFYRAGVRCQRRLAEISGLAQVPVVFWTIVAQDDIFRDILKWPPNVIYLLKEPDPRHLVETVRRATGNRS